MKPYGIPRKLMEEWPDVADIQGTARSGHVGHLKEKCGKYKSYIRSTEKRNWIRRFYKKAFRRQELEDIE